MSCLINFAKLIFPIMLLLASFTGIIIVFFNNPINYFTQASLLGLFIISTCLFNDILIFHLNSNNLREPIEKMSCVRCKFMFSILLGSYALSMFFLSIFFNSSNIYWDIASNLISIGGSMVWAIDLNINHINNDPILKIKPSIYDEL